MLFLAATLRAVDLHSDLMRVAISGVGNDHRLGANEAPPAIVSAYLGDDVEQSVARFVGGTESTSVFQTKIDLGIHTLPDLHRVQTDRNRTSTFAFTGNKFEFRAVGSSHNPSRSNTVLNTIVAQSVRFIADEIEKLKAGGMPVAEALNKVTRATLKNHARIIFNGNGYSAEWAVEAARRGLPNLRTTPAALDTLYSEKNIALFEGMKVLQREELLSRSQILFEDYVKRIAIEGKVLANIALTKVVPVAIQYQKNLADSIAALESVGGKESAVAQRKLLARVTSSLNTLLGGAEKLTAVVDQAHHQASPQASAHYMEKNLIPLMVSTREASDALEVVIAAKDWPLPTYHEMLFHQD
jgi:glutamine synthetase